jgi:DNA invertase Pin-like site-specific DNA recombinase
VSVLSVQTLLEVSMSKHKRRTTEDRRAELKKIQEEKEERIPQTAALRQQGKSYRQIARLLDVTPVTVLRDLRECEERGIPYKPEDGLIGGDDGKSYRDEK